MTKYLSLNLPLPDSAKGKRVHDLIARKAILLFALFILTSVYSCKKEDSSLGKEVLPGTDLLGILVTDTLSLLTTTVWEDSVRTDETSVGYELVGVLNDPVFGTTKGSFGAQLTLPESNVDFGTSSLSLDSIILYLDIKGYYGDQGLKGPLQPQTLVVYELDAPLVKNEDYFSSDSLSYLPQPLGKLVNHSINVTDSITANGARYPAAVRIPLSKDFGEKLLFASASDLANNDNFLNLLKGIYVTAENHFTPGNGAIVLYSLLSGASGLTMYYKDGSMAKSYEFVFSKSTARVNTFRHNLNGTPAGSALGKPATWGTDFYVKGMGSTKGKIEIPHLEKLLSQGNIMINKAELILPVNTSDPDFGVYYPLGQLVVTAAGEGNANESIVDFSESAEHYGGIYNSTNKTYVFNIGRHLNAILTGTRKNNGFFIVPFGNAINAPRVVLKGANGTNTGAKLVVYYTKY